jgi:predicted nucleotidyltransferase component of viral defense system
MDSRYVSAVRLLLAVAPVVFESPRFALKGGTALNLFVQNLPRLSVDIDIVFTDHLMGRDSALQAIADDLRGARSKLRQMGYAAEIPPTLSGEEAKLLVLDQSSQVKVEVNFVFRGTLLPVTRRRLVDSARQLFTTSVDLPVLALPELYGGKLVAALDRQHPRDWFDIAMAGRLAVLDSAVMDCFVAYLAGHNRPVHEVLFSNDLPLAHAYGADFAGMTVAETPLQQLIDTRRRIRNELPGALTDVHRRFLISFVRAEPQWELMPFTHLKDLPAIRWKLLNLEKLRHSNRRRFEQQVSDLMERFDRFPGVVAS